MAASFPLLAGSLAGTVERAVNVYLALAPNRRELLAPIAGKVIAIRPRPIGSAVYVCPTDSGLQVLAEIAGEPDVTLSGSLPAFARLQLGGDVRESLAAGDIEMTGDTDTARRFQDFLDRIDIDWESLLGRFMGRRTAMAALGALRDGAAWTRDTGVALQSDLAEFWHEETRELPSRPEADAFCAGVDILRADRDRLEARIQRLEAAFTALPSQS